MSFLTTHRITTFLASGSFGLVFKTSGQNGISLSATKFLFCETGNSRRLELIQRESNVQLSHENVVKLVEVSEEFFTPQVILELRSLIPNSSDRRGWALITKYLHQAYEAGRVPVYILKMELCGPTLRVWLDHHTGNAAFYKAQADLNAVQVRIVTECAEGLNFLHKNDIIHRDFKPENVMFSLPADRSKFIFPLKIGDFGLSREIPSSTSTSQVEMTQHVGTDTYMAQEVNLGKYSKAADIYSFGLVMWEVLQLISDFDRPEYFHRRVNNNDNHLIEKNLPLPNAKYFIIRMTSKQIDYRMKDLDQFIEQRVRFAHTSDQLTTFLRDAVPREVIYLGETSYEGTFEMVKDNLTLKGMGEGTIMRQVPGESAEFQNSPENFLLSVRGSNCTVVGLKFETFQKNQGGIGVFGNANKISNISLTTRDGDAISVYGDENVVKKLKIKNSRNGITIFGRGNKADYNYMQNGEEGISLDGVSNVVTTFCWSNLKTGVSIRSGSKSHRILDIKEIDKLQGGGGGVGLRIDNNTANCFFTNVKAEQISVDGSGHSFKNVKSEKKPEISGTGHIFTDFDGV